MATFLVTKQMNPELAARVEKSVTGRVARGAITRRLTAWARLAFVLILAFAIYSLVTSRRHATQALEKDRADLLGALATASAGLDPTDLGVVTQAETWITKTGTPDYEGDLVTDEVRGKDALKNVLGRPLLWVRGPIGAFAGSAHTKETAAASAKDALLLCLVDPPTARTEKVLLDPVRVAYLGGSPMELRTANTRRLSEAIVGLSFFTPAFSDRVKGATDRAELAKLRTELDKASPTRTKDAAKSRLFLVALDEPGIGNGPTELDGEKTHFIRLALVDLEKSKVLLRMRKQVNPDWISQAKRPTYSIGLDSCAFAYDVHAAVSAK